MSRSVTSTKLRPSDEIPSDIRVSRIPLSATEQPYQHRVTLASLDGVEIEHIPIGRPVAFLRLPEAGDMRLADFGDHLTALDLRPDLPISERPFVQVRLAREGLQPGFREEIDRIAERFPVRIVEARVTAMPDTLNELVIADALIRLRNETRRICSNSRSNVRSAWRRMLSIWMSSTVRARSPDPCASSRSVAQISRALRRRSKSIWRSSRLQDLGYSPSQARRALASRPFLMRCASRSTAIPVSL
jgi:hypothetical protein